MSEVLKAPFPWFGGKSRVAHEVWARFGDVPNYIEPFFGSGAVLLGRPGAPGVETVNDKDGFVSNFWRAVAADSKGVALAADWPVNENDLHARHAWLVEHCQDLAARLEGDPGFYDVRVAGWWVWGQCCWIGSGWCQGTGPWRAEGGRLVKVGEGDGVERKLPHLGDGGRGVHRKRPNLGSVKGVNRQLPHLGDGGRGVNRQIPDLHCKGQGVNRFESDLSGYLGLLEERLRRVRVSCGDWRRVTSPSVTTYQGVTGVFLDPPYGREADRKEEIYVEDDLWVAKTVGEWCAKHGDNPLLRIAICGYEGEHDLPGWTEYVWSARGGYGNQGTGRGAANASRERIWFSPHCLDAGGQLELGIV